MKINRVRNENTESAINLSAILDRNEIIKRPTMPLSFWERVAEWLNAPSQENRRIKPDSVPTYKKGSGNDFDQSRLLDDSSYSNKPTLAQIQRINRAIDQIEFFRTHRKRAPFDDEDDPNSTRTEPFDWPIGCYAKPLINLGAKNSFIEEDMYRDLDLIRTTIQTSRYNPQETHEQRQRVSRVIDEIKLLRSNYGHVRFDKKNPTSVLIERFGLPRDFNRRHAKLLIDLGCQYPTYPPRNWYLSRGLRKKGRKIGHYFEHEFQQKPFCKKGFAWYSFHIKRWRPNSHDMIAGHNLLKAVQAIYHALSCD